MSDKLLSVKDVSNLLGVHVNTVRTMVEDGRLNGVKTKGDHGHWRFKLSDVQSFMESDKGYDIDSILEDITYILDDIPSSLLNEGGHSIGNAPIWEFVQKYYGIRTVFGSYAIHSEMEGYREIINKKGFVWLGEGSANIMDALNDKKNSTATHRDKFILNDTTYAFGVVKYPTFFGEQGYSCVPLLVVTDRNDKKWIVDGTLQQFYPQLQKGLAVLPLEKAQNLYIGLEIFTKKKFAEIYSDPTISDRFIRKARELETDSSDND